MNRNDFEQLILTPFEMRQLKRFSNGAFIPCSRERAHLTSRHGLIEQHLVWENGEQRPWDGTYVISDDGLRYLQFLKETHKEKLTTRVIAIAALALSALSILAQIVPVLWKR